jgi:hypothetical protein
MIADEEEYLIPQLKEYIQASLKGKFNANFPVEAKVGKDFGTMYEI